MTEVAFNYNNCSKTDVTVKNLDICGKQPVDLELDQCQAAELEAILRAAADGQLWTSMENMRCPGKAVGAPVPAVGLPQPLPGFGLGIDPLPTPVNPTDPKVIAVGQFAVTKHNQQVGTRLVFCEVVLGLKWNIKLLTAYALLISVKDGKSTRIAKALVVDPFIGSKKLLWWSD